MTYNRRAQMYQPDQPPFNNIQPPGGVSLASALVIGLLVAVIVGIVCGGIGFWLGYRSADSQNTAGKVGTPTPAPTPLASPTPAASPTPTPTPPLEIGGKYAGPTGEVEISDVTDKSFSFSIGVGNSGGSGEIDGQAVRNTPTVATFSRIPDETLYNDPESSYYKQKCKLTFRFSAGKVKVSEDNFACSYWHGAQVDFNGTFTTAKKK